MTLTSNQKDSVKNFIQLKLHEKIKKFSPNKTLDNHFALSGIIPIKIRRQYSAIHSLATAFGMSFYEQIAVTIAAENSDMAKRQWRAESRISKNRKQKIEEIIRQIGNKENRPDIDSEIKEILSIPNTNLMETDAGQIVDVYIKRGLDEYYIDIKTVGLNKSGFLDHKRLTLSWVARADKEIHPIIALPYNPYHPKPYKKVGSDVMQVGKDLLVGKDFWDLIGGQGCYEDISNIFQDVGKWYWEELEKKF